MASIDTRVGRRGFLKGAAAGAALAGGALLAPGLQGLASMGLNGRVEAAKDAGYGPLSPTPDLRDGVERLALPRGFTYRSFHLAGTAMSDGNRVPLAHDGMAAFNMRDGSVRLVCNHEDRNAPGTGSVKGDPSKMYDPMGGGGTTTLVIDPEAREPVRSWVSLNGTTVNCAGGLTPWGSWLTCEETNVGPPSGWGKQHGYAFDVPADADSTVQAVALPDLGRYAHEAMAVDPKTWYVYGTEDNGNNSGFYRFIPNERGNLLAGGRLQMLAIDGSPQYNTISGQTQSKRLPVTWVDIPDPNPPGTSSSAVFNQGFSAGGARFGRLEGLWYGNQAFYINSTSGGNAGEGQIWEYRPDGRGRGSLRLIFESPDESVLNAPDNICVTPQGALLLCEDGDDDQYLRGVTLRGEIFDFALNLENESEWAGATFALHGRGANGRRRGQEVDDRIGRHHATLFVNRQGATSGSNPPSAGSEGMTFAIWGPWKEGAL
jgi:secreted PhoX family phosphatase